MKLAASVLCFASLPVWALTFAPAPLPPAGWDSEIAPGYDPPIEEVVIMRARKKIPDEALAEIQAGWDANALNRLQELFRDPRWSQFTRVIADMIARNLNESACEVVDALLRDAAIDIPAEPNRLGMSQNMHALLSAGAQRCPDTAFDTIATIMREAPVWTWPSFASNLKIANEVRAEVVIRERADTIAEDDSIEDRRIAYQLYEYIDDADGRTRVFETFPADIQEQYLQAKARMAPQRRANEPMRLILEKERANE